VKRIGSLLLIIFTVFSLCAKVNVTLETSKKIVKLGDPVLVRVNINGNENIKGIIPPSGNSFDIVKLGTSSNVSIVNGVVSNSYSYNFQLYPKNKGSVIIPPFRVITSSGTYKTNKVSIEVLSNLTSNDSQGDAINEGHNSPNIFFKIIPQKKHIFPNEPVCIKYVLYTKIQFTNPQLIKEPDFSSVISEDFEQTGQKKAVDIAGQQYWEIDLGHRIITPIKTGEITITPAKLKVLIISQRRQRDIFRNFNSVFDDFDKFFDDDFFSSPFTRTVPRILTSKPVKLEVSELPEGRPADYSGLIGDFRIDAKLDNNTVNAGDAVNLTISLVGNGNLNGFQLKPCLGPDLQIFDSNSKLEKSVVDNVLYSKMEDKIVIMPQKSGKLTIPSIKLCFFDPEKKSYRHISTDPITLHVKGSFKKQELLSSAPSISVNEKKDISMIESNIAYIHENTDISNFKHIYNKKIYKALTLFMFLLPFLTLIFRIIFEKYLGNAVWISKKTSLKNTLKKLSSIEKKLDETINSEDFRNILECFQDYFERAFGLPVISGASELEKYLSQSSIPEKVIKELSNIYTKLYQGAYSPLSINKKEFIDILNKLKALLKQANKYKDSGVKQ